MLGRVRIGAPGDAFLVVEALVQLELLDPDKPGCGPLHVLRWQC